MENFRYEVMNITTKFIFLLGAVIFLALPVRAFETSGKTILVADFESGLVLTEKNADIPFPPASLSKLMTLYLVFEALEEKRLVLSDRLQVSNYAYSSYRGGSTMYLEPKDRPTVEELIRGVVVLSGNDACVVLAEALSPTGKEKGFVGLMNEKAREMGLKNSMFANSNGWPDPAQKMSSRDLFILTRNLIADFPGYYEYFKEKEFPFDDRTPANRFNRNPLLKKDVVGADGLKTGYTRDAGYGLVGSAIRDGRRVIFVINGLSSANQRSEEGEAIIEWFYRQFKEVKIFEKNKEIALAPVWIGSSKEVAIGLEEDLSVLLPATKTDDLDANAHFENYTQAPIVKGQNMGYLEVFIPSFEKTILVPLVALEDIEKGNIIDRVEATMRTLIWKYFLAETEQADGPEG